MRTPYFADQAATLYLGDAVEVLRELPAESVHCVVTSPPYNVGMPYGVGDSVAWDIYDELATQVCAELYRVAVPAARVWINVAPSVSAPGAGWHSGRATRKRAPLMVTWSNALLDAGFNLHDPVCWLTPGRGGEVAWGSWQSPAAPNLRNEWEIILCAYKGSWQRPTLDEWRGWQDDIGAWQDLTTNCWRIGVERERTHPAPFPLELPARCIRLSTWPGETVLDPFIGSGTTALAAAQLGRVAIGIDAWAGALDMAAARLQGVQPTIGAKRPKGKQLRMEAS